MKKVVKQNETDKIIGLAGNPNVGKSTVFNSLTGLNQHTGNWAGKTVTNAFGYCDGYVIVDLPGCYSLMSNSADEEAAKDFICSGKADVMVTVCDATCLERNLNLVLQIMEVTPNVIVCVNLIDEAKRKNIEINTVRLSELLGVPVIETAARDGKGIDLLIEAVKKMIADFSNSEISDKRLKTDEIIHKAEEICSECVKYRNVDYNRNDRKLDKLLTGKFTGFAVMLILFGLIFWITITGANYPSQWLSAGFMKLEDIFVIVCQKMNTPTWLTELIVFGIYRTLTWVISVMLPPMAIFFPLFTLLEDFGYLPRIAFNLDKCFKKCSACGKQALSMCMGLGCNAAGVVGCRIIDSPRERLISILTNVFMPCNGRFPLIIAVISMFFAMSAIFKSLILVLFVAFAAAVTFAVSKILSVTMLKGIPSSFTLELPPFRKPQLLKVLVRSLLDRTLFILARAAAVAAPAGLIIWCAANIKANGVTVLSICAGLLEPVASLMGLDGFLLLAFLLAFPANEIVLPIVIMSYTSQTTIMEISNLSSVRELLLQNDWTIVTALNFIIFSICHFPCSTTLITIKKETGSVLWTVTAAVLPTLTGFIICCFINLLFKLFNF